jgi:chromate transporter
VAAPSDFAIALTTFVLLTAWKTPPWLVVLISVLATVAIGLLTGSGGA